MKSLKQVAEELVPKFQRATKTDTAYTGMINGKTYVVPHTFHEDDKKTPIRHAIVVSSHHVLHNNPTLTPEEAARVNSHIKDIHESWLPMRGPKASKETPEVNAEHEKWEKAHAPATRRELKAARPMRSGAADRFMRRYGKTNEERQLALHLGMHKSDSHAPKPVPVEKPKRAPSAISKSEDPQAYQAERDKYRHAALAASRRAATLAFAKKHHIIKETSMNKDPFAHHQTVIAKKTLRYSDAGAHIMGGMSKDEARKHLKKMGWTEKQIHNHEHAQFVQEENMVNEHSGSEKRFNPDGSYRAGLKVTVDGKPGEISHVHHSEEHPKYPHSYKVTDTSADDPYKQTRLRGNTFISHHDIKPLHEKVLTQAETNKKEEIVHKLKPKLQSFKSRYGSEKGKSVMYAVATKQAKKLAEEAEQLNELSDAAKQFIRHREAYWKHAKKLPLNRQQMNIHSAAMNKHHGNMTKAEKHIAHTGSQVSPASRRLQGGSAKGDKEYVHETEQKVEEGVLSYVQNKIKADIEKRHAEHKKQQKTLHKSQFVKGAAGLGRNVLSKAIREEHSDTFNIVKRILRGE